MNIGKFPALGFVLAATVTLGALTAQTASADPTAAGEFALSGATVGTNNQIAQGPDGNMWVTLDSGHDVAKITPEGVITNYDSAALANPVGITSGPDGKMWVTQAAAVASFDPADPTAAVATPLADITDPRAITTGPDQNLWTASGSKVIKIPPAAPATATSYPATGLVSARWISPGANSLWVADFGGEQILDVTPAGVGTAYSVGGGPQGVAANPVGTVIGYTNQATNPHTVGRVIPNASALTTPVPNTDPFGMAYGADGAFWIANFVTGNVGRLALDGASTAPVAFAANSGPRQISSGPANTLWVTLDTTESIGKISGVAPPPPPPTASPVPTTSPVPTASPAPTASPKPPITAPTTKIVKRPAHVVRLGKNKKRKLVHFRFTSSAQSATFDCRLRGKNSTVKKFRKCVAPKQFRLRKGHYTFVVRAKSAGAVDPTPAKWKIHVKRR